MPSHAAVRAVSIDAIEGGPGWVDAEIELACGCRVKRRLPGDRVITPTFGPTFVVGKYPCPKGHLVSERRAAPAIA